MKSFDVKREQAPATRAGSSPAEPTVTTERDPVTRPVVGGLAFPDQLWQEQNDTGLPDDLKAGIEHLSGISLDHVTVHYDSALPAQVGARAYTQGHVIHVGPGQEEHLPHEAWHVVQQAQGRVRPTVQLKARQPVNDDRRLEQEADVMGALALRWRPSGADRPPSSRLKAASPVSGPAPLQMVQIVSTKASKRRFTLSAKPDDYKLVAGERQATERQILAYKGADAEIVAKKLQLEAAARSSARKKVREERRQRAAATQTPKPRGKQVQFPVVVQTSGEAATLVYRGMSVNNVNNWMKTKSVVFNAQNPKGTASPIDHIVDDSKESPYLSFEVGGLGISAGKYAAKPVDDKNKPLGVTEEAGGFLKMEKSYTVASQAKHAGKKRIGYVGGIPSAPEHLDVSDRPKAEAALKPVDAPALEAPKRDKAVMLAVADKEILVTPGEAGIGPTGVPFVAKVKVVDEAYFKKNIIHQTPTMALGFYKSSKGRPVYSKIQVTEGKFKFKFQIPPELLRNAEDSEDEMSDVEDMELSDYK